MFSGSHKSGCLLCVLLSLKNVDPDDDEMNKVKNKKKKYDSCYHQNKVTIWVSMEQAKTEKKEKKIFRKISKMQDEEKDDGKKKE